MKLNFSLAEPTVLSHWINDVHWRFTECVLKPTYVLLDHNSLCDPVVMQKASGSCHWKEIWMKGWNESIVPSVLTNVGTSPHQYVLQYSNDPILVLFWLNRSIYSANPPGIVGSAI